MDGRMTLSSKVYWMTCIALIKAWREFLLTGCPNKRWDDLLEEYGENQAASKYRLDAQLIYYREDCIFFGVTPITIYGLQAYMPDVVCCDIYLEECQSRLDDLAPVIPLEDI